MHKVKITPEAVQDMVELARGVDRTKVALDALRESSLSPAQVKQLEALLKKFKHPRPEASSTIKTATHGFSIVTAADGKRAVQFIKTLDDGTKVTYQICEGARGTPYWQLAQYGKEKLKGATLRTHSEFEEMVDELFKAVEGQMVADGELQTEDEALKLAFQIVQEGVSTKGCWLFAQFFTEEEEEGRAVSGRRVRADGWDGYGYRLTCAFFGVSSPESK
jgi:hypothetical protein